jgi:hypothetical protein
MKDIYIAFPADNSNRLGEWSGPVRITSLQIVGF